MRKFSFYLSSLFIFILFFSGCSRFFEKDNTPQPSSLVTFKTEIKPRLLWTTNTWISVNDEYLKQAPAVHGDTVFTSSASGYVIATNKWDGRIRWRHSTRLPLTSGPGVNDDLVIVGSRYGEVIALNPQNGSILWKTNVKGEVLANPALYDETVVVKTTDGNVYGLNESNGQIRWQFQQTEPSLILRGSSAPLIANPHVFVGFANGNLAKLTLDNGELNWLQPVATPEGAFAIQRMIDIDADPIIYEQHVYAATYQGKIASLDWTTGQIRWSHDISSYTGMKADDDTVYITDAKSKIWAFDTRNGDHVWKQTKLQARGITAPALIGDYLVVGDAYGYLHWLDKHDGHFVARNALKAPILAPPIADGDTLYVLTVKGHLHAFQLE